MDICTACFPEQNRYFFVLNAGILSAATPFELASDDYCNRIVVPYLIIKSSLILNIEGLASDDCWAVIAVEVMRIR
jgi:hypothetical protein